LGLDLVLFDKSNTTNMVLTKVVVGTDKNKPRIRVS